MTDRRMDCIQNESTYKKIGVTPIRSKVCEGWLRWYSHVQCGQLEALPHATEDIHTPHTRRKR